MSFLLILPRHIDPCSSISFWTFQRLGLYLTCGSFKAWCTVSEASGLAFQSLLLLLLLFACFSFKSLSYLPQLLSVSPLLLLTLPLLLGAPGAFRKSCVNMRKSIPSQCRGAGQTLCGGNGERVEAGGMHGGGGCRCMGGGEWEGDMLLDKRKPIDLFFCTRVCVSIGPLGLLRAWLTGSEMVRILRCGLSLCVYSCLCVCNWGHVTLIYKLDMRGLLHYS